MRQLKMLGPIVLAALLAGLLGAPPTAQAAPGFVTVRVTIDRVSAVDCFEGTFFGGCLGAADFYAVASIDGFEFPETDDVENQNNADPDPDWVFERQVDLTHSPAPVSIEIREDDGFLRFGDGHADIDPTNGGDPFNLELQVTLSPQCAVAGDATLTTAQCGTIVASTGTADNNKARIFYKIEVIDPDTDGDSLPDSWENGGLDADGNGTIDVDLPAMGANPQRKDLFLEIDCLVAAGNHSHCPVQAAIQTVVQSFADAPLNNLDGSRGIQLHVDIGTLYGQALGADTKVSTTGFPANAVTGSFGNYGSGDPRISESAANLIVDWDGATGSPATNFYSLKGAPGNNFNANRALAYRYGLFVHQVNARLAANDCTSGWAEGGASTGVNLPGNDLIVSLGGTDAAGNTCWAATANQQAGTLQHELGHTLGLDHGGGDTLNNKPNYLSVMNYGIGAGPGLSPNIQMCAIPAIAGLPGGCDYSRSALPTLNEVNPPGLDECAGIGLGLGGVNWNAVGGLTGASCSPPTGNVSANINGDFTDTNGDGAQNAGEPIVLGALPGFDDWNAIRYDFRTQGNFGDGVVPSFPNEANPQTLLAARAFMAQLLRPVLSVDKTGNADAAPGDTLSYGINVENTGNGPALSVVLTDTKPDSTQVTFNLGLAVVGAEFDRSASFSVPCATADGTVVTNTASATAVDLLGNAVSGSDAVSTTVHAPVLTLSKTAIGAVNAGEAITYRISYENTGSGGAASVVVTDTLPADVYYSAALDPGGAPAPTSVTRNGDGTTTLTWNVGNVAGNSGAKTIGYTARPSLLFIAGGSVANGATLTFTNANGCTYTPVVTSHSTGISSVAPTRNALTHGYWKTHPGAWTNELLARIQATDQRFDGADGSAPNGQLSAAEVAAVFAATGTPPIVLTQQLLATYFNLATRRINAGTAIDSKTAGRLLLGNVRGAALFGIATLALPRAGNTSRYSDAILILDEINSNKSEVY